MNNSFYYVLCAEPFVAVMFEHEVLHNVAAVDELVKAHPAARLLLQLGFERETDKAADELANAVKGFCARHEKVQMVVLANAANEATALTQRGVRAMLCSHNVFLDESRYAILPARKVYDAAYLARITPFKRHQLVPNDAPEKIMLLGCGNHPSEEEYAHGVHERLKGARFVWAFRGLDVSRHLAAAWCGLALSASEGAMFASAEYFLCGLPVVNTPALGGRESTFPDGFTIDVESTPQAVRAGIQHWLEAKVDPREVRAAFLRKVAPFRKQYFELMRELTDGKRITSFPHKLGLRTPHPSRAFSMLARAYLLKQRMAMALKGK